MIDKRERQRMTPDRELCPECGENELMQTESVCTSCMINQYNDRNGKMNLEGI